MVSKIANQNLAADDATDHGNRLVFALSNGNALAVVRDTVSTSSAVERFTVYESVDRVVWTQRALIYPTVASRQVTATVDASDNLHVLAESKDGRTLSYAKMTYVGYSVSANENIVTVSASSAWNRIDIDVSDAGQVYVAGIFNNGQGGTYGWALYTRNSSNAWGQSGVVALHSDIYSKGCETISICAAGVGTINGTDYCNVAVAVGHSRTVITPKRGNTPAKQTNTDMGVRVYYAHVRPTTGLLLEADLPSTMVLSSIAVNEGSAGGNTEQGRLACLFRDKDDVDKVILGIMHSEVNRKMFAMELSFALGLQASTPQVTKTNVATPAQIGARFMGMTIAGNTLLFTYGFKGSNASVPKLLTAFVARLTSAKDTFLYQSRSSLFIDGGYIPGQNVVYISSGGQRNGQSTKADVMFATSASNTNRKFYHEYAKITGLPNSLVPADGTSMSSSNPSVQANMDFDRPYMQVASSVEFQFANDSAFTSSVIQFKADAYDVIDGTDKNSGSPINGKVPSSYSLGAGLTWYMRARNVDSFGNAGNWCLPISFTVSHPPAASGLSPTNNKSLAFGSGGSVDLSWTFTDPSSTDSQTAYQVQVVRGDTGAVVLDTGKVGSPSQSVSVTIPASAKGIGLQWRVSLWDSANTQGNYSGYATFTVYDGPTTAIGSPTTGQVVVTAIPHVTFTPTTANGATIKSYRVVITQGSQAVFDTGTVSAGLAASGSTFTVDGNKPVLHNNQQYSLYVTVTDGRDIANTTAPRSFSAAWNQPTAPTSQPVLDVTAYNVEDQGYVRVTWTDGGKDPDFVQYIIQRRDDLINVDNGTVLDTGDWKDVGVVYDNDTNYEYHDLTAPSNYKCFYRIVQGVARFGDTVYSDGGPSNSCLPVSDGYWFVDPTFGGDDNNAFKLFNVTSDSYTEEYEEASYVVIGRGNHVDRGERLGYNGSLSAQLWNTGSTTARQKKLRLEEIKSQKRNVYLRTPFGDVFPVSVGNMGIERVAGVGASEFCNVTIPYLEVGV